jgi:hypothetical protein
MSHTIGEWLISPADAHQWRVMSFSVQRISTRISYLVRKPDPARSGRYSLSGPDRRNPAGTVSFRDATQPKSGRTRLHWAEWRRSARCNACGGDRMRMMPPGPASPA